MKSFHEALAFRDMCWETADPPPTRCYSELRQAGAIITQGCHSCHLTLTGGLLPPPVCFLDSRKRSSWGRWAGYQMSIHKTMFCIDICLKASEDRVLWFPLMRLQWSSHTLFPSCGRMNYMRLMRNKQSLMVTTKYI